MGDVFAGRYELVDPLGEGGVGTVWRAWDRRRRHYCAVKVLRQVDAASLLRFIREQSLRLEHPHVLTPTGWAGEDDKVLFAMPMVRGGSVATLVGDFGPLPAPLTAVLLDQLLSALESIHSEGVVHRDVKPANLLLDATGAAAPHLWLGDFGIAAGVDEPRLTQGPYALGTPGYLAPEVRQHGWHPDPRADLFSAGMSAVEMLTGTAPEAELDVDEALRTAARAEPVPDELHRLVTALAEPSLSARIGSAAEARRQLAATGLLTAPSEQWPGQRPGDVEAEDDAFGEVEFFDHIPELPEGWTDHGPAERGAPEQGSPEQGSSEQSPAGQEPAGRESAGQASADQGRAGAPQGSPTENRSVQASPTSYLPAAQGSYRDTSSPHTPMPHPLPRYGPPPAAPPVSSPPPASAPVPLSSSPPSPSSASAQSSAVSSVSGGGASAAGVSRPVLVGLAVLCTLAGLSLLAVMVWLIL